VAEEKPAFCLGSLGWQLASPSWVIEAADEDIFPFLFSLPSVLGRCCFFDEQEFM